MIAQLVDRVPDWWPLVLMALCALAAGGVLLAAAADLMRKDIESEEEEA